MDFRVITPIIPLAPAILVGAFSFVGIVGAGFKFGLNLQLALPLAAYVLGLAGVVGLFLASLERTNRSRHETENVIIMLLAGIASCFICLALYATAPRNSLVSLFVVGTLIYPVTVAADSIIRLRTSLVGSVEHGAKSADSRKSQRIDLRILASIIPLAPLIYTGWWMVYPTVVKNGVQPVSALEAGFLLAFCIGLLGLAGLVLASLATTYSRPKQAKLTIILLISGILAAVGIAFLYWSGSQEKLLALLVTISLLCPVIVGVDSIRRLVGSFPPSSENGTEEAG